MGLLDKGADRPRERLDREGARVLADAELLALVLRTGDRKQDAWALARSVLERFDGLVGLAAASGPEIEAVDGLGPAKAASLRASFELARRIEEAPLERGKPIRGPNDVQRHFLPRLRALQQESFQVLLMDGRHRLICVEQVSIGTLTASLVHPREVFRQAVRNAAAALLLVHNHPSGDPSPSAEDRAVSERLRVAGELLGIRVLDHIIVSDSGYYSFREAGEVFRDEPVTAAPRRRVADLRKS
ncbi:MAG: hypothetical protein CL908_11125 [Deltaproteobacteria bacterium]|nr:hypothetical protein [Deltaproteobacteria bacterium]